MRAGVWIEAARPRTLPAAVAPVVVGSAAASDLIAWRAVAAGVVALALQVGVNLANDLFDAERGIDTDRRVGPRRATATGLVSPRAMRIAIGSAFAVASLAGVALTIAVGPELLLVGALCIVAALGYSGGPKPYASAGLGEVSVFLFFGVVATVGSAYVQDEVLSRVAYAAAVPIGLLAAAILVVNNLRDIETDGAAGKITLAVKLGAGRTRRLYQGLVVISFASTIMVAAVAGSALPLFALAAAPLAVRPVTTVVHTDEAPALVDALGATARLLLAFALLLALGLWLA